MRQDRPERPLDDDERRALAQIAAATQRDDPGLAHRLSGTEGIEHPPVRRTGTPLRWWVVGAVMTVAVLFALVVTWLPPVVAPAVVFGVLLIGIPAACVVWARRRNEL
ncbi:DUF3040 domain-containing protein [Pseudonocardia sp. HH130630-07]|uniref:DUF3040 domain-containing protein n=1 Tax=Pseudonocardia sp. HH130630-07 TaxID=1690815 RepID=UPI0008153DB1|nr:DUF3040 domain-containing protein [Pseudonocardia sp. HH130630-07]ANY06312.1 hypothetical protein AFB00_08405 [Pseudonocardia sp. HH130630-07]